MATVELRGCGQRVTEHMPPVCACCGRVTTHFREQKFAWFPKWTYALAPLGVAPFVAAMWITRKVMTVRVPLCEKHPRPWLALRLVAGLNLLHLLVLFWVASFLAGAAEAAEGKGGYGGLVVMGGWLAVQALLLVAFLVVMVRTIRPKRITEDGIILAGVSEEFASHMRGNRRALA